METSELIRQLRDAVPLGEILAQLAEECSELAKAALKYRRAMGYAEGNPTPVSDVLALQDVEEEIADVYVVLAILDASGITANGDVFDYKLQRWAKRVAGEEREP